MEDSIPSLGLLEQLARRVRLREGPAGVERLLWTVAQKAVCTTKEVSQEVGIPVPVVAALRRELEKLGYLTREKGMRLSPAGEDLARRLWGEKPTQVPRCPSCRGTGFAEADLNPGLVAKIEEICRRRPAPDVRLDQAHLEPHCLLSKAALLIAHGCILGRRILFLGDDDLLSLGVLLFGLEKGYGPECARVEVLDIDPRVLEYIQASAENEGVSIAVHPADARNPLPDSLRGGFDSVITDPPYTLGALENFLDRAVEALSPSGRGMVALSFGRKSDPEQVQVQRILSCRRMAVRDLYSGFNRYLGAAILGGVSDLYILTHASGPSPSDDTGTRQFYTAEAGAGRRKYRCLACGHCVAVGPEQTFTTIEALKNAGCPQCGKSRFRYAGR